jgi:holo-[acyl-carrier protein] synthase
MIAGIGIDIVEIERIRGLIERYGSRFIDRVFSPCEISYCRKKKDPSGSFAARFAVKEAFVKALGTGMIRGMKFNDVSLEFTDRPEIKLSGAAESIAKTKGIASMHASISHEKGYAIAIVILEV